MLSEVRKSKHKIRLLIACNGVLVGKGNVYVEECSALALRIGGFFTILKIFPAKLLETVCTVVRLHSAPPDSPIGLRGAFVEESKR